MTIAWVAVGIPLLMSYVSLRAYLTPTPSVVRARSAATRAVVIWSVSLPVLFSGIVLDHYTVLIAEAWAIWATVGIAGIFLIQGGAWLIIRLCHDLRLRMGQDDIDAKFRTYQKGCDKVKGWLCAIWILLSLIPITLTTLGIRSQYELVTIP